MILSTDEEYIQSICQQYGELGVSTYPMKIDNTDEILDEEDECKPNLVYAALYDTIKEDHVLQWGLLFSSAFI